MKIRLSPVQKITYCGLLIVLNLLLTRIPGFAQVGGAFSFNRIGLGTGVTVFSSLFLGPFYGAIVGVAGDALGWVSMGQFTGTFNFFLSFYYALLGICPYFFAKILRIEGHHSRFDEFLLYSIYAGITIAFICGLWIGGVFDQNFTNWNMELISTKIVFTCVSLLVMILTGVGLFFCLRSYKKRQGQRLPNPYRVGLVCVFSELITIFIKPLAFCLFCTLLLGKPIEEAWHIDYSGLVMLSLIFSFADIPLNTFFVNFACLYARRYVREEIQSDE